ncbi:hypothetical protein A3F03_04235 [Candidatus Roizmanbacteria bacterium RIFCSPHIGHO2_12_FULL_41_11]|uniref:NIF system FeS cluster assembly NifU N-terminal domain-containing protein n=3 Tax=Candidatus Roizmaniibacteriota TaxID=1752723 RepID=A0A1F7JS14_9BACT|nr:MAG: hypothetical protein A3F03_04235 [Candidatus Roizmanbacteria bacterium RIFCSPHIGHO2_12_FULL_41_11]OGK52791.1 MAG: hypothetical protein A2966_04775 [Candidatus Roizmanbacteria bacterium RIFCSPLOWO2_01_FULL_41_22]OGK58415.1 MAG: hypothetical protein A3H86_03535 [Candidatus Roizmanbacteria bacterium RIFCSPLOWO2_02_FULL_41_9]
MTIYQEIILDHYRSPRNFGILKKPSRQVAVANPLCGDKLEFTVKEEKGVVKKIAFQGEGCAISIAAASLTTEHALGKSKEKLQNLDKNLILKLLGINLSPNRVKCALLAWEGLKKVVSD